MIGIGDYDGKSRNTRHVRTREDQILFYGHKYRRDKATGYYVCTSEKTGRKRLHVAIWEHEAGQEVPPGCVVHHLDWDKTHNEISNLVCVTVEEHNMIHNPPAGSGECGGRELGYKIKKERGLDIPPGL